MHELVPQAARYFALVNPRSVLAEPFVRDLETGAASLGIHIEILRANSAAEVDAAFAQVPQQQPATVLLVNTDQPIVEPWRLRWLQVLDDTDVVGSPPCELAPNR
jgi:hypothetical protein